MTDNSEEKFKNTAYVISSVFLIILLIFVGVSAFIKTGERMNRNYVENLRQKANSYEDTSNLEDSQLSDYTSQINDAYKYAYDAFDYEENEDNYIVYITATGHCYHSASCSYLKSEIPINKQDAIAKGYYPCSRCNP